MGDRYKGTTLEQDVRFGDKEKKLLKSIKFPAVFDTKVDMSKVVLEVIKPWIGVRISELLGLEDEVVVGFAISSLEDTTFPDPKRMQINLTGFLEANAAVFMKELWKLLISAQASPSGIPAAFLEKAKEKILQKKKQDEDVQRELQARRQPNGSYQAGDRHMPRRRFEDAPPPAPRQREANRRRSPPPPASSRRRSRSPPHRHHAHRGPTPRARSPMGFPKQHPRGRRYSASPPAALHAPVYDPRAASPVPLAGLPPRRHREDASRRQRQSSWSPSPDRRQPRRATADDDQHNGEGKRRDRSISSSRSHRSRTYSRDSRSPSQTRSPMSPSPPPFATEIRQGSGARQQRRERSETPPRRDDHVV